MQNMNFISRPAPVKAIQFLPDGSNFDHVINIIKIHGGFAELGYLKKDGSPAPKHTITENRCIILPIENQIMFLPKGTFFVLEDGGTVYPIEQEDAKLLFLPLEDINQISNGLHTFKELYAKISDYEPTLEQILVSPHMHVEADSKEVQAFIRNRSICVTDSEGIEYYVLNGLVYILD